MKQINVAGDRIDSCIIKLPYNLFIRKLYIFLFFMILSDQVHAQIIIKPFPRDISKMKVVDSCKMKVIYVFTLKENKDIQYLEIGQNLSKYYSYCIYCSDSVNTNWDNRSIINHNDYAIIQTYNCGNHNNDNWSEHYYSEYFLDYTKNTLAEYARMPMYMYQLNCFYKEDIPKQEWQLHDSTRYVHEYLCQKATCNFRGRNYTAWFAPEIPVAQGPWKFGGLPGLIMKIYEDGYKFVFECIEVKIYENPHPVKIYNYINYKETTRRKIMELQKKIHENYFNVAGMTFTKREGAEIPVVSHCFLELE